MEPEETISVEESRRNQALQLAFNAYIAELQVRPNDTEADAAKIVAEAKVFETYLGNYEE